MTEALNLVYNDSKTRTDTVKRTLESTYLELKKERVKAKK